jgi:hypothetical protein
MLFIIKKINLWTSVTIRKFLKLFIHYSYYILLFVTCDVFVPYYLSLFY